MKNVARTLLAGLTVTILLSGCSTSSSNPLTPNAPNASEKMLSSQSTLAEQAVVIDLQSKLVSAGWIGTAAIGSAATVVFINNIRTELTNWYSDVLFDDEAVAFEIERAYNTKDIKGIADLYVDIQRLDDVSPIRAAINNPALFVQRLREDIFPRYLAGEHASNPEASSCCSDSDTENPVPSAPGAYPQDVSLPPAPGFTEWRGKPPIGGDKGAWTNPQTGDSLHPDLDHPDPVGPHWDWNIRSGPNAGKVRWFPDGTLIRVK